MSMSMSLKVLDRIFKYNNPIVAATIYYEYATEMYDRSLTSDPIVLDSSGYVVLNSHKALQKSNTFAKSLFLLLKNNGVAPISNGATFESNKMAYKLIFGDLHESI